MTKPPDMRPAAGRGDLSASAAALAAISGGLLRVTTAEDTVAALPEWLGAIGAALGASHATCFEFSPHEPEPSRLRVVAAWADSRVPGRAHSKAAGTWRTLHDTERPPGVRQAHRAGGPPASWLGLRQSPHSAASVAVPVRLDDGGHFLLLTEFPAAAPDVPLADALLAAAAETLVAAIRCRDADTVQMAAERWRSALLAAVNEAGTRLLTATGGALPMHDALERVGRAIRLDRLTFGRFEPPDAASRHGYILWETEWRPPDGPDDTWVGRRGDLDSLVRRLPGFPAGEAGFLSETAAMPEAHRERLAQLGARAVFAVPVMVDGVLGGALRGGSQHARFWSEADRQALTLLAGSIGSALSRERQVRARVEAEAARAGDARAAAAALARRRDLLQAVVDCSGALLAAERVADAAGPVAERLGRALEAGHLAFVRLTDDTAAPGTEILAEWHAEGAGPPDPRQTLAALLPTPGEAEAACLAHLVRVDGRPWGAVLAHPGEAGRPWDEADAATLRLVTDAVGSLVRRERLTEARLLAERELAEEKARMAREIHDTLAQGFTGVIMQMHATEDALEAQDLPDAARHTARALDRARMGLAEARRSVYALRPPLLDDGDLAQALRIVTRRVFDSVETQGELQVLGEAPALPEAAAAELLRIAQEAIGNALRHARARKVTVRLDASNAGALVLSVEDDGTGFDLQAPERSGYGLVSMRERAARLGTALSIESAPGAGTRVTVALDLATLAPPWGDRR